MSVDITKAFVEQYKDGISHLSQQKGSRLRATVMEEPVSGKKAYFDQVGQAVAQKRTSRHADTPLMDTPHSRREVTTFYYEYADLVDDSDKIRTLNDPTSAYQVAAAWAMGRGMDDEIISAATGTAQVDGGAGTTATATALPSTQLVAVDFVESGSATNSGLTIGKLREADRILGANDVDPDVERYIAVSQQQITDLLQTTEVTSADFNTVKALVEGNIDTFMGFKFVKTQRLATSNPSGTIRDRTCFAYLRTGIKLGVGKNPTGRVTERDDKSYSVQVYYAMDVGATRMEEEQVVQITCREVFT